MKGLSLIFTDFSVFFLLSIYGCDVLIYSRFKQLKEQEARKRREREEKRKAEEAAVKGNQLAIEEHKKERSELEEETGGAAILVDKKIGSLQSVTGQDTSNVKLVNGDQSSQELNKGENTISSSRMKDGVVCANSEVDRMDEQQSYEDLEKVYLMYYMNIHLSAFRLIGELRLAILFCHYCLWYA